MKRPQMNKIHLQPYFFITKIEKCAEKDMNDVLITLTSDESRNGNIKSKYDVLYKNP